MLAIVMSIAVSRRIAFEICFGYKKKTLGFYGYESSVEAFIVLLCSKGVEKWLGEMR